MRYSYGSIPLPINFFCVKFSEQSSLSGPRGRGGTPYWTISVTCSFEPFPNKDNVILFQTYFFYFVFEFSFFSVFDILLAQAIRWQQAVFEIHKNVLGDDQSIAEPKGLDLKLD